MMSIISVKSPKSHPDPYMKNMAGYSLNCEKWAVKTGLLSYKRNKIHALSKI
jgi:hypothetical protein